MIGSLLVVAQRSERAAALERVSRGEAERLLVELERPGDGEAPAGGVAGCEQGLEATRARRLPAGRVVGPGEVGVLASKRRRVGRRDQLG